jgi:hypothetical protein
MYYIGVSIAKIDLSAACALAVSANFTGATVDGSRRGQMWPLNI